MKDILQIISNTLLVNLQTVKGEGLLSGKLGIMLFLSKYSRFINDRDYEELSDNYINEVLEKAHINHSLGISDGLAGIGYAINYLIENKLVEVDDDINIFEEYDKILKNFSAVDTCLDIHADIPLFSKGLYFIAKKDYTIINKIIKEMLSENILYERKVYPLCYLNSLMYFFLKSIEFGLEKEKCVGILKDILKVRIQDSIESCYYHNSDLVLLKYHLKYFTYLKLNLQGWEFVISKNLDEVNILDYGIISFIYGYKPLTNKYLIKNEVLNCIKDISSDNLSIHLGISGLGLLLFEVYS